MNNFWIIWFWDLTTHRMHFVTFVLLPLGLWSQMDNSYRRQSSPQCCKYLQHITHRLHHYLRSRRNQLHKLKMRKYFFVFFEMDSLISYFFLWRHWHSTTRPSLELTFWWKFRDLNFFDEIRKFWFGFCNGGLRFILLHTFWSWNI